MRHTCLISAICCGEIAQCQIAYGTPEHHTSYSFECFVNHTVQLFRRLVLGHIQVACSHKQQSCASIRRNLNHEVCCRSVVPAHNNFFCVCMMVMQLPGWFIARYLAVVKVILFFSSFQEHHSQRMEEELCPVCNAAFAITELPDHVERCLARQARQANPRSPTHHTSAEVIPLRFENPVLDVNNGSGRRLSTCFEASSRGAK